MSELSHLPEMRTLDLAKIDAVEVEMMKYSKVECPVKHTFTPGLYGREVRIPKGTLVTSKIHLTQHQYVVSQGAAAVWIEDVGWELIEAPHHGVTEPGTRRVLYVLEDIVWTTFHPTSETDPDKIEKEIIYAHTEHLKGLSHPVIEENTCHSLPLESA